MYPFLVVASIQHLLEESWLVDFRLYLSCENGIGKCWRHLLGRVDDTFESHALAVWFYQVHPVRIPIQLG